MPWSPLSAYARDLRDTARRLGKRPPFEDLRAAAAEVAVSRYAMEIIERPTLINVAGLAVSLDPLLAHTIRADVPELVDATDLHALPAEPPRLLRRAWLVEVAHPERGERLFGDTACLGGYQLEDAIYLVGLTYPDGAIVVRWTPSWSGEEIAASVAQEVPAMLSGVDPGEHQAWGIDAARFATVLGLLLDAAGTPVRVEDEVDRGKAPPVRSKKAKPPPAWITRYVSLSPATWGAPGRAPQASGEASPTPGREATVRPVRGHLKRQRHGPGNAETRWLWVESYDARRWVSPAARRIVVGR